MGCFYCPRPSTLVAVAAAATQTDREGASARVLKPHQLPVHPEAWEHRTVCSSRPWNHVLCPGLKRRTCRASDTATAECWLVLCTPSVFPLGLVDLCPALAEHLHIGSGRSVPASVNVKLHSCFGWRQMWPRVMKT